MKKTLSILLAAIMMLSFVCVAFAADSTNVTVTIANAGSLVLINKTVKVTDIDSDKAITVNDVLYCTHEQYYDGGAEKGYKAGETQWGLSLQKLWGVENGGSYGYYVNDKAAWSLTDTVKADDSVYAFVYSDLKEWKDQYVYFDKKTADVDAYSEIELTLSTVTFEYDAQGTSTAKAVPVEGAEILLNGKGTGVKTDAQGKASITVTKTGESLISASAPKDMVITPPACVVNAKFNLGNVISYYINYIISLIKGIFSR